MQSSSALNVVYTFFLVGIIEEGVKTYGGGC